MGKYGILEDIYQKETEKYEKLRALYDSREELYKNACIKVVDSDPALQEQAGKYVDMIIKEQLKDFDAGEDEPVVSDEPVPDFDDAAVEDELTVEDVPEIDEPILDEIPELEIPEEPVIEEVPEIEIPEEPVIDEVPEIEIPLETEEAPEVEEAPAEPEE